MRGHRRSIDTSPEGRARALQRQAQPVAPLSFEALLARGLAPQVIEECRRRRRYEWIDLGLDDLERAGLIRRRWSRERLDHRIDVLVRRLEGRQVIAALFTPALRRQLDSLWDAIHEHGAGTFWCGRFLAARHEARIEKGSPKH